MVYAVLKLAHVAAVIVWVGGMVFAHFFLRPSVQALEPAARLSLLHAVLHRFFGAVLWAVPIVVGSGLAMIALVGGEGAHRMSPSWTLMAALGLVMAVVFGVIRFVLFPRLARAVAAGQWSAAAVAMNAIRRWVSVNLALGTVVVLTAFLRWPA